MFDGDEDGAEELLSQPPESVQKRKEIIDIAKKAADELAALKLPPSYEEVDFSDDDRLVCTFTFIWPKSSPRCHFISYVKFFSRRISQNARPSLASSLRANTKTFL